MNRPSLIPVYVPQAQPGTDPALLAAVRELARRQAEHANAIDQLSQGQGICRGTARLTANATTTTVTNDYIPANAGIQLTAGPGTWLSTVLRVSSVTKGQFVITHSNEAATNRDVFWTASVAG